MIITGAMMLAGGMGAAGSLLKGHMASRAAVKKFARAHGERVYSSHFNKLRIDQKNQDTVSIFKKRVEQSRDQYDFNASAAGGAYENEQRRLNEIFARAAFAREDLQQKLAKVQGAQRATTRGVGSSKSADRANLINSLGNFGREQAKITKQLASERMGSRIKMGGISGQHLTADYQAWQKVAIPPTLEWAGPAARMGSTQHLAGSPLSLLSAGISGFQAMTPFSPEAAGGALNTQGQAHRYQ